MNILGLDISTKVGWAGLDSELDLFEVGVIKGKGDHGMPRICEVWTKLAGVMSEQDPAFAVIEGYAYMAKGNTLTKLVETGAVIRWNLWSRDWCPYIEVAPTMLKKFVTNKGNANKEEMMVQAFKRWGVEGTNDEVDALALAKFGQALIGHGGKLAAFQEDTITRYKKNHPEVVESLKL